MSKLAVASKGSEGSNAAKSAAAKKPEINRVKLIEEKIKIAHVLERQVRARAVFQEKLILVDDCLKEVKEATTEPWESNDSYRVTLGTSSRNTILSFNQNSLLLDFLSFLHGRIEKKLTELDNSILSEKI